MPSSSKSQSRPIRSSTSILSPTMPIEISDPAGLVRIPEIVGGLTLVLAPGMASESILACIISTQSLGLISLRCDAGTRLTLKRAVLIGRRMNSLNGSEESLIRDCVDIHSCLLAFFKSSHITFGDSKPHNQSGQFSYSE